MLLDMGKSKRRPRAAYTRTYIREWRKHRGLSLEELASRVETTAATLSRIERGQQPYSQPLLEALAQTLNCRPADLIMRPPGMIDTIESVFGELSPTSQKQFLAVVKALKDAEPA